MIVVLKNGKKMIPLKSGRALLIGAIGHHIHLCNSGERPMETNVTAILAPEELDDFIAALSDLRREILLKLGTYAFRVGQVV